jgi:hypothetical protein
MKDMGGCEQVETLQRALSLVARVEPVRVRDHEAHSLRRQVSRFQTKPKR